MSSLLLKGARIVDPSQKLDGNRDLLVEDGKIAAIGTDIGPGHVGGNGKRGSETKVLDVSGKVVVPGLIDMHTHLREPGYEYKETVHTGSRAAVTGGFTAIACMPNTEPINDNRSVTEFILRRAKECDLARVNPVAAISKGSAGQILAELGDLRDAGAVGYSDDGSPVTNSRLMRKALEYAASLGVVIISHCEDLTISKGGLMNEGFVSTELGLKGIPAVAEDIMVARDIALAEYTGTTVHIAHVSTAGAVRLIRDAKVRGVKVTAETAPHYFTLTEDVLRSYDTNAKVNPPLRGFRDVEAVKAGLRDGTIDVIASDHAPQSTVEKDVEFENAANGMVGLETSLGLSLGLVEENILSLSDLVMKMSVNPAAILRLSGGSLRAGADADITVIDLSRVWVVDVGNFRSKSRNSPFHGRTLKGKAFCTIVGGEIKHIEG